MDTSTGNQISGKICCSARSSRVLPTFLLITLDEPYLVCGVLHTEEFYAHLQTRANS